jgi:hypothetical protein
MSHAINEVAIIDYAREEVALMVFDIFHKSTDTRVIFGSGVTLG